MSVLIWLTIVYGVLVLPALVVFFSVLVATWHSPDQPPYVLASWACMGVPVSGWLLLPLLILIVGLWELPQELWAYLRDTWDSDA